MSAIFCFNIFINPALSKNIQLPPALTLNEAIQIAVKQNPEVNAVNFQLNSVKSKVFQARSGFFPQIYFNEAFNHTSNPMWVFGTKLNQGTIRKTDFDPAVLNDPDSIDNF